MVAFQSLWPKPITTVIVNIFNASLRTDTFPGVIENRQSSNHISKRGDQDPSDSKNNRQIFFSSLSWVRYLSKSPLTEEFSEASTKAKDSLAKNMGSVLTGHRMLYVSLLIL